MHIKVWLTLLWNPSEVPEGSLVVLSIQGPIRHNIWKKGSICNKTFFFKGWNRSGLLFPLVEKEILLILGPCSLSLLQGPGPPRPCFLMPSRNLEWWRLCKWGAVLGRLMGYRIDSQALSEGLDLTRHWWQKRSLSWPGCSKGQGRRVRRFLLCRWNYAGCLVFIVWTAWQELWRDKSASSWDLGIAPWQQVFRISRGSAWRPAAMSFQSNFVATINICDLHSLHILPWRSSPHSAIASPCPTLTQDSNR